MQFTLPIILTIIGLTLSVSIPLITHILKARRENRQYYSVIWKKSSGLKPKDMLGERPYSEYYYERSEDIQLKRQIERRNNVLVLGPPLSGKTRAVYQQLVSLKKNTDVLIPRNVAMSTFVFPKTRKFWRKKTIFIDDLQYFIEKQDNYFLLLKKAKENKINVITTCHTGLQFNKVKNKLTEQNLDIETIFGENVIEYSRVSQETAKEIAAKMNISWDKVKFNGTVGSIFMKLSEMEKRFDSCSNIEKTILNSIRVMYLTGLWENNMFSLDWIKLTAKKFELEGKNFEWAGWLKSLEDKEFIKIERRNKIWADDAYLQYIIKPLIDIPETELFDEMADVFSSEPSALGMIGEKAYNTGLVDIDISMYMKLSVKAFSILKKTISTEDKAGYARASEYLGLCYWKLSIIEDIKENCLNSLHNYTDALKVITPAEFPVYYSRLQTEIGNSYTSLAEVQDRVQNCKKAIECFNESLKYISAEEYPVQYAMNQHNLGGTYFILSQEEESAKNLKLSIQALQKALRIRTLEQYPREYALTNNNLGTSYANLSETDNKSENLKRSIEHFNNVLKVYDRDKNPFSYATTASNLGNVYSMLAEIEDLDENIKKAVDLLNESLEIRTPDKFPLQYAASQHSLGDIYLFIARCKRSAEYCYNSIDALEECILFRTLDKYPLQYALSQNLLGEVYSLLSEFENKSENYQKALVAFDEALKVYTEETHPLYYAKVRENISSAKKVFFK